jgi:hypothetical protein
MSLLAYLLSLCVITNVAQFHARNAKRNLREPANTAKPRPHLELVD